MRWFGMAVLFMGCTPQAKQPRSGNVPDPDDTDPVVVDTDDTDTDVDTDTTQPSDCEDVAGDNHTVDMAVPLVAGATYRVDPQNKDWFTVQVPGSTQVTIDLTFANGDIDARLRNGPVVASGITTNPNEQLEWTNTGAAVEATLEVYAFGANCLPYTVQVSFQ